MSGRQQAIVIIVQRIEARVLLRLVQEGFGDMVTYVAEVGRSLIAIGGDLHADAGLLLLESGSRQEDLWGANDYPGRGPDGCIEYTALINIRPAHGNRGMEIMDSVLREKVRALTHALIGTGEEP